MLYYSIYINTFPHIRKKVAKICRIFISDVLYAVSCVIRVLMKDMALSRSVVVANFNCKS